MADAGRIREIVESVVVEVFDAEMGRVREELVQRTLESVRSLFVPPAEGSPTDQLKTAVVSVEQSTAQSDILRVLLDGAALFSGRAALFIVRGPSAVGWQARGFRENDAIKLLTLDLNMGLAARAIQQRTGILGPVAQFEPRFVAGFGAPADGDCMVLPLLIRDKVAALIYADAGTQLHGTLDASAIELLVGTAGRWLELLALRKAAGAASPHAQVSSQTASQIQPVAASTQTSRMPSGAPSPAVFAAPAAMVAPELTIASAAATPVPESASVEDAGELHRKAQRFAKLLVDEIKLYNQSKVAEGKMHSDLYERLKDDIEKSRATYNKRYAQTSVGGADYFAQELVRGLADNDSALLGSNFPR